MLAAGFRSVLCRTSTSRVHLCQTLLLSLLFSLINFSLTTASNLKYITRYSWPCINIMYNFVFSTEENIFLPSVWWILYSVLMIRKYNLQSKTVQLPLFLCQIMDLGVLSEFQPWNYLKIMDFNPQPPDTSWWRYKIMRWPQIKKSEQNRH